MLKRDASGNEIKQGSLRAGDMTFYANLYNNAYSIKITSHHYNMVEEMVATMRLTMLPYAVAFGEGEVWACYFEDVMHPDVPYEFVGYAGTLH